MNKEINFKDIKNIIQKSIDINNAYIVKHNELLLIYNAYKKPTRYYGYYGLYGNYAYEYYAKKYLYDSYEYEK